MCVCMRSSCLDHYHHHHPAQNYSTQKTVPREGRGVAGVLLVMLSHDQPSMTVSSVHLEWDNTPETFCRWPGDAGGCSSFCSLVCSWSCRMNQMVMNAAQTDGDPGGRHCWTHVLFCYSGITKIKISSAEDHYYSLKQSSVFAQSLTDWECAEDSCGGGSEVDLWWNLWHTSCKSFQSAGTFRALPEKKISGIAAGQMDGCFTLSLEEMCQHRKTTEQWFRIMRSSRYRRRGRSCQIERPVDELWCGLWESFRGFLLKYLNWNLLLFQLSLFSHT